MAAATSIWNPFAQEVQVTVPATQAAQPAGQAMQKFYEFK